VVRLWTGERQIFERGRQLLEAARYADIVTFQWNRASLAAGQQRHALRRRGPRFRVLLNLNDWTYLAPLVAGKYRSDVHDVPAHVAVRALRSATRDAVHSKFIVTDSRVLLTSANVDSTGQYNIALELAGAICADFRADFARLWARGTAIADLPDVMGPDGSDYDQEGTSTPPSEGGAQRVERVGRLMLLSSAMRARPDQNAGWRALLRSAVARVRVITPNMHAPSFLAELRGATARGVRVQLVVPQHFNVAQSALMDGATTESVLALPFMARVEVRFHPHMHAKYLSADGRHAVVGSGNHDPQSWEHSVEHNVLVDDAAIVARMDAFWFAPLWARAQAPRPVLG